MKKGQRIRNLYSLSEAAASRKSVIVLEGSWERRYPAAFIMNCQGTCILEMFESGMWLNIPKKPVDPNAPRRKFTRKPEPPKPVLGLPYYP